jgi:hypothetical protein
VRALLARLRDAPRVAALLMYGSGLRLLEALQLRVKDLDFTMCQITIRRAMGGKDRVTVLPDTVVPVLWEQLAAVGEQHGRDLAVGAGRVALPFAYDRKSPHAAKEWGWRFGGAARRESSRAGERTDQAGYLSQPAALLRDPPAAGRLRHPHRAGAAGAPGRGYDDKNHPLCDVGRVFHSAVLAGRFRAF